jgi:hypothetical protein
LDGVGPDHPVIQVLAATLRVFREAGIPTLVFTIPINVEFMDSVSSYDSARLARTIRSVRQAARDGGAGYLDLHELLPDAGFRDAPGHLAYEGDIDGPRRLAVALAPSVLRMLNVRTTRR